MNDEQIEAALRRYQPTRPAPSLRTLIVRGRPVRVALEWVDWALVAAAVSLMGAALWPSAGEPGDPLSRAYQDRVEEVAEGLGGDVPARDMAVIVLAAQPQTAEG